MREEGRAEKPRHITLDTGLRLIGLNTKFNFMFRFKSSYGCVCLQTTHIHYTATENEFIVHYGIWCVLSTKFSYGLTLPLGKVRSGYVVLIIHPLFKHFYFNNVF